MDEGRNSFIEGGRLGDAAAAQGWDGDRRWKDFGAAVAAINISRQTIIAGPANVLRIEPPVAAQNTSWREEGVLYNSWPIVNCFHRF